MKEIQLFINRKIYIILLMVLTALACNNVQNTICLKPVDRYPSKITYNKIKIFYLDKDSIKFSWMFKGSKWNRESYFRIKPEGVFEMNELMTRVVNKSEQEEILTFSKTDTNFIHRGSKYYPNVIGVLIFKRDCRYKIKKVNNNISMTTITSMVDSAYKEIYYYNSNDFNIIRFEYHTPAHNYIYESSN